MKSIKDNFSSQAATYKKYRPTYPDALYQDVISMVKQKTRCWDCGTGNGQVAIQLAKHFDRVYATDISRNQLDQAPNHPRITYKLERAEKTSFPDDEFDLITVAQAIHWFDFKAFNNEVKRVGKNGSILGIWGYGLLRIDPDIDRCIDDFYYNIIGPYWNRERKHIDNAYQSILFDFEELPVPENRNIHTNWTLHQLEGYLNSWSSVQHYKKIHPMVNPVAPIIAEIQRYWKEDEIKTVKFPIFMRLGRIEK